MGYNCRITKGGFIVPPHRWPEAHAAILRLDNAPDISACPAGDLTWEPGMPLRRMRVAVPVACLESETLDEAIREWPAFDHRAEFPWWKPERIGLSVDLGKGIVGGLKDEDWRSGTRDENLWHAIAPYVTRGGIWYEGEDRRKWAYGFEQGVCYEYHLVRGQGWRKGIVLHMRDLVPPRPLPERFVVRTQAADGTWSETVVDTRK